MPQFYSGEATDSLDACTCNRPGGKRGNVFGRQKRLSVVATVASLIGVPKLIFDGSCPEFVTILGGESVFGVTGVNGHLIGILLLQVMR